VGLSGAHLGIFIKNKIKLVEAQKYHHTMYVCRSPAESNDYKSDTLFFCENQRKYTKFCYDFAIITDA